MGNLSTAMKAIIKSGHYKVRQYYIVYVPSDANWTANESKSIHLDGTTTISVTDHGVMKREGFNQTIPGPGKLGFGLYKFQVSNADGTFTRGASLWTHTTSGYVADPEECKIGRYIAVSDISLSSYQMVPGTYYIGKINKIEYKFRNIGTPVSAAIFCEPADLVKITDYHWGEDDYDNIRLEPTSGDTTFYGPLPGEN